MSTTPSLFSLASWPRRKSPKVRPKVRAATLGLCFLAATACSIEVGPQASVTATEATGTTGPSGPGTSTAALPGSGSTNKPSSAPTTSTPSNQPGSSTTTSAQPTTEAEPKFPEDPMAAMKTLVGELCRWGERCCTQSEFQYIYGPSVNTVTECTDRVMFELSSSTNQGDSSQYGKASDLLFDLAFRVNLLHSEIDRDAVKACHDDIRTRKCLEPASDSPNCDPNAAEDLCRVDRLFRGTVPSGGRCDPILGASDRDIECVSGSRCQKDPKNPGQHICVDVGALNGACSPQASDPTGDCEAGLYCAYESGTCVPRKRAGESCAFVDPKNPQSGSEKVPCAEGLSCSPHSLTCVSSCEPDSPCGSQAKDAKAREQADRLDCKAGLSCLPTPDSQNPGQYLQLCGTPGNASALCDSDADCVSGLFCAIERGATTGLCRSLRQNGESGCQQRDEACADGHYCDLNNVCRPKIAAGASQTCTSHRQCAKGAIGCVGKAGSRTCVASKLDLEAACDPDAAVKDLPDSNFDYIPHGDDKSKIGISDFRYWGNYCKSGVCDPKGTAFTCSAGAGINEVCDNNSADDTLPTCRPGLQCLAGRCQAFLEAGQACQALSDPSVPQCDYRLLENGEATACEMVHGGHRCRLPKVSPRSAYCDGR